MIEAAMRFLLETGRDTLCEVEKRPYSTVTLHPVLEPQAKALELQTLTGLVDYLQSNIDGLLQNCLLVNVTSATTVALYGQLQQPFAQRQEFVKAQHQEKPFEFGKFMDIEQFVIELQAKFVQDEMTATILQVVGNITDGVVNTFADDGVTQQVTSKSGIGRVIMADIPNPVTLQPYRTFSEIEQPPGRFILRMMGTSGEGRPRAALFEADGGAWRLEAIHRIKAWLQERVPAAMKDAVIA